MNNNSTQHSDFTIDFRGSITSIALLELSRLFTGMEIDKTITVILPDKDIITDICKVLPVSSLEMTITEKESSEIVVFIKKNNDVAKE